MFTTKNLLILIGRNMLIALAAITISLAVVFFLSKEISRVSDSVLLNHHLQTELSKRTGLLEVLKHDAQIIGTNDVKIADAYAPSDNILGFINTLDTLATKNILTQVYHFETPMPSDVSTTFPISTIAYTNNFEASVGTFSNYLKNFNKLPYFTKIEGFSISSQDKQGWLEAGVVSYKAILYTK